MTSHKTKPPVKVRASSVRVRRLQVRDAINAEIEGALRLALNRAAKYHDARLPSAAEETLLAEADNAIGLVLDSWLDWGES